VSTQPALRAAAAALVPLSLNVQAARPAHCCRQLNKRISVGMFDGLPPPDEPGSVLRGAVPLSAQQHV
jgi:hypothetical protein